MKRNNWEIPRSNGGLFCPVATATTFKAERSKSLFDSCYCLPMPCVRARTPARVGRECVLASYKGHEHIAPSRAL
eukprot:4759156-Amphidinium_carterae.1